MAGAEDFGQEEQWEDEEFDEKVSHASSRMNDSSYAPGRDSHYGADPGYQQKDYRGQDYQGYQDYPEDQSPGEGSEIEQIVEETYEEVGDIQDPEKQPDF